MKMFMAALNIPALIVAATALANLGTSAQTVLWTDNFDDNDTDGWVKGYSGEMAESNQQFRIGGSFGPTPINQPTETYAFAFHDVPISGALQDQQKLEARVDLVEANQSNAWASMQFFWTQGLAYAVFKDEDEILLAKAWLTSPAGISLAFFYYESRLIKNQNVTLVLSLTRLGEDVRIGTRVLDKDNGNAVLFERTVTDTPQADPVVPNAREFPGVPDFEGTPWPISSAPQAIELGMGWADSQRSSAGPAQVIFDNLEVRLYESPQLTIRNNPQSGVLISWPLTVGAFVPESAPGVGGPWGPVPDSWWRTNKSQNEVLVETPVQRQFFRLRQVP
jgi:hypothetical protein